LIQIGIYINGETFSLEPANATSRDQLARGNHFSSGKITSYAKSLDF
jgi:hypothetical protein